MPSKHGPAAEVGVMPEAPVVVLAESVDVAGRQQRGDLEELVGEGQSARPRVPPTMASGSGVELRT